MNPKPRLLFNWQSRRKKVKREKKLGKKFMASWGRTLQLLQLCVVREGKRKYKIFISLKER